MILYESDLIIEETENGIEGIGRQFKSKNYSYNELKDHYEKIKPIIEKINGKSYTFDDYLKSTKRLFIIK